MLVRSLEIEEEGVDFGLGTSRFRIISCNGRRHLELLNRASRDCMQFSQHLALTQRSRYPLPMRLGEASRCLNAKPLPKPMHLFHPPTTCFPFPPDAASTSSVPPGSIGTHGFHHFPKNSPSRRNKRKPPHDQLEIGASEDLVS